MKQTRAQEQRFFPWAHEALGLELVIAAAQLDDRPVELADPRARLLDLCASWERARLELEVHVPKRIAKRVVAPDEREDPPLAVLVALRCTATHLRRRVARFDWDPSGRFALTCELLRAELAQVAELDAFLIRSRPLARPQPGVAARVGARLASARPWVLQIDEPAQRSGHFLDVQYRSFIHDPNIPVSQRAALYRLEIEREDPILYLNAELDRVRAVLDNKGTHGRRVRARELLYERIQAGVWTQLLVRVATRLADDGELAYPWEQAILAQWLPQLYPDAIDEAARIEQLRRDVHDLPGLLSNIDAVLQVSNALASCATKLVEEL